MTTSKRNSLGSCWLAAVGLILWGLSPESGALGPLQRTRSAMGDSGLNRADMERVELGYYETLLSAGRSLDRLDSDRGADSNEKDEQPFRHGWLAELTDDVLEYRLKPSISGSYWVNQSWSTNEFGMRDQPYEIVKPPDTVRLALVGDSIGVGWGVSDGASFEGLLETAWSKRFEGRSGFKAEFLNFAVPGYAPGQRWEHFSRLGWKFDPDLVVYQATPAEMGWDERRLRTLLSKGRGWETACYRDTLRELGVSPGGDPEDYKRLLRPKRWVILEGVYRRIVADCRSKGVACVYVLIPRVGKESAISEREQLLSLARRAGFQDVIDLSGSFEGIAPEQLMVGPHDYHPNAAGHAILADRLRPRLEARPELRMKPDHLPSTEGGRL